MIKNLQRLLYIEARLILSNLIARHDVMFDLMVSGPTATRALHQYRDLAPENVIFVVAPKQAYQRSPNFKPVLFNDAFNFTVEQQASNYLHHVQCVLVTCANTNHIELSSKNHENNKIS